MRDGDEKSNERGSGTLTPHKCEVQDWEHTREISSVGAAGGNWNHGPALESHGEVWPTPYTELANGQNREKYGTITSSSHGKTKGCDGSQRKV